MARIVMSPEGEAEVAAATDHLVTRVANLIAEDMRRYCPVDTGAMRAGIDVQDAQDGSARVGVSRNVPGDDPKVPLYVEYGTRRIAAEPFIRPAAYQKRSL